MKTECDLISRAERYLVTRGRCVVTEVPFLGRSIDMVFFRPSSSSVFVVEFKLRDWRRAVKQAKTSKFGSELSFIALPIRMISDKVLVGASACGIGVIGIAADDDNPLRVVLRPRRAGKKTSYAERWLQDGIKTSESEKVSYHAR